MDFDLSSGVMLSVAQLFGFTIRTVSKRDTLQLDVNIGTQRDRSIEVFSQGTKKVFRGYLI
jgi:hypothetical protein